MEKILTCTECRKTFKVHGIRGVAVEEQQGIECPFCKQTNQIKWPRDTVFTTIPETAIPKM